MWRSLFEPFRWWLLYGLFSLIALLLRSIAFLIGKRNKEPSEPEEDTGLRFDPKGNGTDSHLE